MLSHNAEPGSSELRLSVELDSDEALRLLGSVSLGRIVFTQHALPAVRPVTHVLDDGNIVIRTHDGAALTSRAQQADGRGVVVAYEADAIDPDTHLGWSVVVTGYARPVTDPHEVARYQKLLRPRLHRTMDHTVVIRPDLVTGTRLTETGGAGDVVRPRPEDPPAE
ncbi:nitroimidazol reductase NimA-like FMN-containing flavoprotein (pyridoxamine 5'-phosphate oxidase superfamily) [Streptomyces sp. V3I8]|uniref:pyridoxamine 5'-phosphate oxidase family protein n=1 Tax=Streptomyces sp. V3I8 TaxID=3042279 RepID=UPI00278B4E89|nr:pyridoxamine 5'-phosphate oxidase family protein [Streptomyces sp. V3I8]MDQ1034465.1 nitroimidazol reductase NimA-like FMN-containing flavoprotein (pyridoxamine 5'-phosphate oxidase superfamily) [Streptomyces sp. V3I8]